MRASLRGAGRDAGGAGSTTMLIWKVIAASPGITRDQIWERVEHDIPPGWALRRYSRRRGGSVRESDSARTLRSARGWILTKTLADMRQQRTVTAEGDGPGRQYFPGRPPRYHGNPDAIDETGTKAAEHMAVAAALRTVEAMLARGKPAGISAAEYEAVMLMTRALRAGGAR